MKHRISPEEFSATIWSLLIPGFQLNQCIGTIISSIWEYYIVLCHLNQLRILYSFTYSWFSVESIVCISIGTMISSIWEYYIVLLCLIFYSKLLFPLVIMPLMKLRVQCISFSFLYFLWSKLLTLRTISSDWPYF